MGDLIPGLPEEVARECLVRVGFEQLPAVRRISRQWKAEVESPDYARLRRAQGLTRPVLALVQAQPELAAETGPANNKCSSAAAANGMANSYRMVLMDTVVGRWLVLPPLPGPTTTGSLPLFCQVAAVGGGDGRKPRLVVVGGWDPVTWAPTDSVYIYDFFTGAWSSGAPMPGPRRSFFACAAVGRTVYVAGGHDEEKNALRSALAYDADADKWAALPDMAEERDEPRGLCVHGKFMVVSGYPTQAQGRFVGSAEVFDPATSAWTTTTTDGMLLDDGTCPRTCAAAEDERMYMVRDGHLMAREGGGAWRTVIAVPEDARTGTTVSVVPDGRVVVIGSGCHGGDQIVYTFVDKDGNGKAQASWASRAAAPREFAGHVISSCFLEI